MNGADAPTRNTCTERLSTPNVKLTAHVCKQHRFAAFETLDKPGAYEARLPLAPRSPWFARRHRSGAVLDFENTVRVLCVVLMLHYSSYVQAETIDFNSSAL